MSNNPEKEILKEWLDESITATNEMKRFAKRDNLSEYKYFDKEKAWMNVSPAKEKRFSWMKYAACLVLLVMSGIVISDQSVDTNTSDLDQIHSELPDGSVIISSSGTTLDFDEDNFNKNRVGYLTGRAFFDVAKKDGEAFVVKCDGFQVEVLGTEFEIDTDEDKRYVYVREGKVKVSIGVESYILTANQFLDLNDEKLNPIVLDKNHKYNSWIEGKLVFEDNAMNEVFNDIAFYTGYSIQFPLIENIKKCRFSSVFESESIEDILQELDELFEMEYEIKNKQVVIHRFDCN